VVSGWSDAYADPLFRWVVLGGSAVSMGAFLAVALPLTALAWRTPAWAASWRIQAVPADVRRWFWPSLRAWGRNNAILLALLVGTWPLWQPLVTIHLGPWSPWWVVLGQLLLFIYLDDALYYVMHRAMHHGWLYRHIHRHHHRITRPCAISGHDMHPVEFVLTALLMLVGPLLLGVHVGGLS
jgi:Sterol desaturase